ncbi:MAG: hypothetical protein ACLPSF_06895 [Methylocella sp.]
MKKRLGKARRILAAQAELDRLAAWRLIDLERQAAGVDERRIALVGFLDAEPSFGGPFAGAMMRRLEALEASRAALRVEQAAQAEKRLAERARMRCAAGIVKTLEQDEGRREERLQLGEAIEASLARPAQGSGKFEGSS